MYNKYNINKYYKNNNKFFIYILHINFANFQFYFFFVFFFNAND